MRIFFTRHGQTTGDVEDRYGGDYDDHLSEEGVRQSQEFAQELENKGIEAIYASPLIRAQETAQILSERLGLPYVALPPFKERNQYGILTGMPKTEAKEKYPELVEKLKDRLNTIKGAESYETFKNRVQRQFEALFKENSAATVAVVWHGGPMRVLFRDILKKGELKFIGDCAWVELENESGVPSIKDSRRIEFLF